MARSPVRAGVKLHVECFTAKEEMRREIRRSDPDTEMSELAQGEENTGSPWVLEAKTRFTLGLDSVTQRGVCARPPGK